MHDKRGKIKSHDFLFETNTKLCKFIFTKEKKKISNLNFYGLFLPLKFSEKNIYFEVLKFSPL